MKQAQAADRPRRYRITIQGPLTEQWQSWFGEMQLGTAMSQNGQHLTTLTGSFKDQSALQGALRTLHNLGHTLLSVEALEGEAGE